MTLPTGDDVKSVQASPYWTLVIALWLIMLTAAVTLALSLLIWTLVEAF